jgi:hypothetical protein
LIQKLFSFRVKKKEKAAPENITLTVGVCMMGIISLVRYHLLSPGTRGQTMGFGFRFRFRFRFWDAYHKANRLTAQNIKFSETRENNLRV